MQSAESVSKIGGGRREEESESRPLGEEESVTSEWDPRKTQNNDHQDTIGENITVERLRRTWEHSKQVQ